GPKAVGNRKLAGSAHLAGRGFALPSGDFLSRCQHNWCVERARHSAPLARPVLAGDHRSGSEGESGGRPTMNSGPGGVTKSSLLPPRGGSVPMLQSLLSASTQPAAVLFSTLIHCCSKKTTP